MLSITACAVASFLAYFPSILIHDKFDATSLQHLGNTECSELAVNPFLFIAHDGAMGYQDVYSRLQFSICDVFLPLPMRFQNPTHGHGFCHLIDASVFDFLSANMAFQLSPEIDRTPSDRNER